MRVYEGELLEGGVSTKDSYWKRYSYLKIGTDQLNNICISPKMDLVLRTQINKGNIKLWVIRSMWRNIIIGITQPDGQTYRQSLGIYFFSLICMWGFFLILLIFSPFGKGGLLFFGIFFLFSSLPLARYINKVRKVNAEHSF